MQKLTKSDAVNKSSSSSRQKGPGAVRRFTAMPIPQMRVPTNDLHFDTETYVLLSIYYQAGGGSDDWPESVRTYLDTFAKEIETTGKLLQWLGLATPDEDSPLGSKPSHELISLIVKPRKGPVKGTASDPDDLHFEVIFENALDNVDGVPFHIIGFVQAVLAFLGLIEFADDGQWIVTERLINLCVAAEGRLPA
jgi:hypothetical protein